ncbi:uncharacterized protein LOC142149963 isoform X2 [Mixophyes fleayi]|uniref:uncharacterized protein LOC142149963 isoform X2 n=1 Tax=Mixophyes fleayi TaxID=3061075 RepID=UPI003F4DB26D
MSRLADIHTGIMTYMSQTISAGAQSKWGRKKLEKVLEQTKVDIVQLTDQLLQAKEDLTLKDQKMKELLKQNEMRMLENQHFKTQLEVTKGSLQTLQDETAIQRSLLEAELRRQVGRLEELDNKAAVTGKQFTDASTQWEILESVLKDGEGVITDDSEEEMAEKTTLTEFTEEQNDVQNFKMELNTIEIGSAVTEEVSEPESLDCNIPSFPIFDEAISDTTLYSVVEGNNSTISSVCVEEERNTSLTSLPLSQNSEPTMTQPPNISTIQLCDASEVEIHHIDKNNSEMYPATSCAELQESVMLVLTPPVSPENMMSLKDKFTQSILPPVIEEKGHSAIAHTDSAEISDGNLSLSLPSGGCNVTTSCHETDKTTQLILSVPMAEKYTSPITAISLSHKRDQWSQTDGSNTLFQESEKNNSPITLLKTDEDTNPMTTIPINDNSYTYLMISPSNIKTSADFPPPSTLEQNIHISVPADNTMTALSPSYENGDLTASIPELDQSSHNSISVPVPDVNTLHFTSLPVFDKITEVITSLSAPSDIIRPVTSPPLDSENSNIDESVHTISLIIPDHKMQPPETHEAEVTPEQNQGTLLSKDTGSINQPSEPAILCKDLAGVENKKTGWTFHTEEGEVSPVKSLDSSDHHAQLWGISQRLHKCMQEIRELLTTEGFHSLADGLTEEVEGNNADGISGNLKQLENFPAVLHSLLHTATRKNTEHKQLPDEHSQGADVTSGNKSTEKNCPLLSMHTEDGTQTCDDLSVHAPLSHDSGNTRSLIFTRLDEEHNRRVLQRARYQGRLPGHLHQDASRVMTEYRMMRQERLQVLVWRYVIYIAWKRAENLLQKQCLLRPQVTPTLTKLQKLKHQVFLRWREKMMQSQEERLSLSVALHQTLQGVQEESGIFLIKPVLSWPASSSATETRKEIRFRYKALRQPTFPSLDQCDVSATRFLHWITSKNHLPSKKYCQCEADSSFPCIVRQK